MNEKPNIKRPLREFDLNKKKINFITIKQTTITILNGRHSFILRFLKRFSRVLINLNGIFG